MLISQFAILDLLEHMYSSVNHICSRSFIYFLLWNLNWLHLKAMWHLMPFHWRLQDEVSFRYEICSPGWDQKSFGFIANRYGWNFNQLCILVSMFYLDSTKDCLTSSFGLPSLLLTVSSWEPRRVQNSKVINDKKTRHCLRIMRQGSQFTNITHLWCWIERENIG